MSFLGDVKTRLHEGYMKTYNAVTTVSNESNFKEGVLTPDEFVIAGDALVYRCPTWSWGSGGDRNVDYLPADKQYLITKNVPCMSRADALEQSVANAENESISVEGDEDEWVGMAVDKKEAEDVPDASSPVRGESSGAGPSGGGDDDDDDDDSDGDIPDADDFEGDNVVDDDDAATLQQSEGDNILKTRTYDISITYDKYYQTPRVWLFGYDENGQPLKPQEIFKDISEDHARKTVTIDTHPAIGISQAYIHPCKHAPVMKKIMDNLAQGGKELRVDQYLFLFLKFISAVIPTIEYDYTISADLWL